MKYLVIELQTAVDGTVANLVNQFDDRLQAESAYHTILAAAAVSSLPIHAAVMLTNDGTSINSAYYVHEQPAPEPNSESEG